MKLAQGISTLLGGAALTMGVLASATPAQALTWTFNSTSIFGPNTSNEGIISGSFDYDDSVSNTVSNVSIHASSTNTNITNGAPGLAGSGLNFNSGTTTDGQSFNFTAPSDSSASFNLNFASVLSSILTNSVPSGQSFTVGITGNITENNLQVSNNSGGFNTYPIFANFTVTGTGTEAVVPFEVPGGATLPVFGSILALAAMRKFRIAG